MAKRYKDGSHVFDSHHDFRLSEGSIGPHVSDFMHARMAFEDFRKALAADDGWRTNFTIHQVRAIEAALLRNWPRIEGFVWHHHVDNVMQLLTVDDHRRIPHYGGRFLTGGRCRHKDAKGNEPVDPK